MNKTQLMMQSEAIHNASTYSPAASLQTLANVVSPIVKASAKSVGTFKKAKDSPLFIDPVSKKGTNKLGSNSKSTKTDEISDHVKRYNKEVHSIERTNKSGKKVNKYVNSN